MRKYKVPDIVKQLIVGEVRDATPEMVPDHPDVMDKFWDRVDRLDGRQAAVFLPLLVGCSVSDVHALLGGRRDFIYSDYSRTAKTVAFALRDSILGCFTRDDFEHAADVIWSLGDGLTWPIKGQTISGLRKHAIMVEMAKRGWVESTKSQKTKAWIWKLTDAGKRKFGYE